MLIFISRVIDFFAVKFDPNPIKVIFVVYCRLIFILEVFLVNECLLITSKLSTSHGLSPTFQM